VDGIHEGFPLGDAASHELLGNLEDRATERGDVLTFRETLRHRANKSLPVLPLGVVPGLAQVGLDGLAHARNHLLGERGELLVAELDVFERELPGDLEEFRVERGVRGRLRAEPDELVNEIVNALL
jgi:hypothetical protein